MIIAIVGLVGLDLLSFASGILSEPWIVMVYAGVHMLESTLTSRGGGGICSCRFGKKIWEV
jgi:hypothetical protein